jgi:hypothetical protein
MKTILFLIGILIACFSDLFSQIHYAKKVKVQEYSASLRIMNDVIKNGCIQELNDSTVLFEEKSNPRNIFTIAVPVNLIDQINFVKHGYPPVYMYILTGFFFGGLIGFLLGSQDSDSIIDPGPVFTSLLFGAAGAGVGWKIGNTEDVKAHRELKLTFPIHGNLNNYKASRQKMIDLLK